MRVERGGQALYDPAQLQHAGQSRRQILRGELPARNEAAAMACLIALRNAAYISVTPAQVHRLAGMVNVVNKMCEVPNCFKRPSLNYPGVRPAVRCGEHKLEGMTNAFRKSTTPKSASESNDSPPRRRAKSTDGDTTDSGSDADDASPTVSQPPSTSKNHIVPSPPHDVSSPSSKLQSSSGPPIRHPPSAIRHPPSVTLLFKFAAQSLPPPLSFP